MKQPRILSAFLLACALTLTPVSAFEIGNFQIKPTSIVKGSAALAAGKFCWKHKVTCGAVIVGGAIAGSMAEDFVEEKKAEIRAQLTEAIRARFGEGFDVCELFETCREIISGETDYRVALSKVSDYLGSLGAAEENFDDERGCHKNLYIIGPIAPEAAQHVIDAQAAGWPSEFTYAGSADKTNRRNAAMRVFEQRSRAAGLPTSASNKERDEYPPASMLEAGINSSVRLIDEDDNDMGGRMIRTQTARISVGCRVTIIGIPAGAM